MFVLVSHITYCKNNSVGEVTVNGQICLYIFSYVGGRYVATVMTIQPYVEKFIACDPLTGDKMLNNMLW